MTYQQPILISSDYLGNDSNEFVVLNFVYRSLPIRVELKGGDDVVRPVGVNSSNTNFLIFLGDGNDNVITDRGNDTLVGGNGNDQLLAQDGDNVLDGGDGDDFLQGYYGRQRFNGGKGNDTLISNEGPIPVPTLHLGSDTLSGGAGNDRIVGGRLDDSLYGNADNDLIYGLDGNDSIWGGTGADTIYGGSGYDTLIGGEGSDRLVGGDGNDALIGGINKVLFGRANNGWDTLEGGVGADRFIFKDLGSPTVIEDFSVSEGDRVEISKTGFNVTSTSKFTYNQNNGYLNFSNNGIVAPQVFAFLDAGMNFDVNSITVM